MAGRRSSPRSSTRPKNSVPRVTPRRRPERVAQTNKDWERRLGALGDPSNPWHPMRDE